MKLKDLIGNTLNDKIINLTLIALVLIGSLDIALMLYVMLS